MNETTSQRTARLLSMSNAQLIMHAQDLTQQRDELLAALTKAREDINWMLNEERFLNSFVFDYIDNAIASVKGGAA